MSLEIKNTFKNSCKYFFRNIFCKISILAGIRRDLKKGWMNFDHFTTDKNISFRLTGGGRKVMSYPVHNIIVGSNYKI